MIEYAVTSILAELSATTRAAKKLCLVRWNGAATKLDLRQWMFDENGGAKPGKGVTLTDEEAHTLLEALQTYFSGE